MKFFYADSLDLVDPKFDFEHERSLNPSRVPQRDDVYAHELLAPERPYDGLLVSKSLFRSGGGSATSGKYSQPQRKRFEREGARTFLRFPPDGKGDANSHPIMGDCGAFAYRNEEMPPYSIDELIDFYEFGDFSFGISLDHVVLAYDRRLDDDYPVQGALPGFRSDHTMVKAEAKRRQLLSLANAETFLQSCQLQRVSFRPVGAAHGWSATSYLDAVRALLKMGYDYIAIGGLVPLRDGDIAEVLEALQNEVKDRARLHLLGVVRPPLYQLMRDSGVASFDSSSPLIQAFKDARDNYYAPDSSRHYTAARIPQANLGLPMRLIRAGAISQEAAVQAEQEALVTFRAYGTGSASLDEVVETLEAYDELLSPGRKTRTPSALVRRTLMERPWDACPCPVCRELGIEVVLFRGANRNRRRGFHNLWLTQKQLEEWRGD